MEVQEGRSRSVSRESPRGPGGGVQTSAPTSVKMMRFTDYGISIDCGKDGLRNGATDYIRNVARITECIRITECTDYGIMITFICLGTAQNLPL